MKVVQEIREERNDVYSFWESKKQLNETQDGIVEVEEKVDEATILELEKRIFDFELQITEITEKILLEKEKLNLIKEL
jgi:hypothetical protein